MDGSCGCGTLVLLLPVVPFAWGVAAEAVAAVVAAGVGVKGEDESLRPPLPCSTGTVAATRAFNVASAEFTLQDADAQGVGIEGGRHSLHS